jgi:hypothetical protein
MSIILEILGFIVLVGITVIACAGGLVLFMYGGMYFILWIIKKLPQLPDRQEK